MAESTIQPERIELHDQKAVTQGFSPDYFGMPFNADLGTFNEAINRMKEANFFSYPYQSKRTIS